MRVLKQFSLVSSLLLLLGAAACDPGQDGTAGATKASGGSAKPAPETAEPVEEPLPADAILEAPGVDLSKLDEAKKTSFFRVLNTESSACGKPHSLAVSLRDDGECRDSMLVAQFIAGRIGAGALPADIKLDIDALVDALTVKEIPVEGRPVYGNERAPVTMVVFADFQCPMCKAEAPELRAAIEAHKGRVKLVFKHFPLPMHARGHAAALAAEAAGIQGKFWEMHDKLFANQQALEDGDLESYALQIGLDVPQFKIDVASEAVEQAVTADREDGTKVKIGGTPTVFINGRLQSHQLWDGDLDKWIEDALRR